MTLKPIDEQIIVIRLGADQEFKSRFPSIILPDTFYEDPSGLGIVHDFDDCDPVNSDLRPLREIIQKGSLVRFTRHATGRRFMDVTGDREIVLPNEHGIPTTYSFIRREHLLAVIETDSPSPFTGKGVGDGACADRDTIEGNKALELVKYGLLDPDDFDAVFHNSDMVNIYREPNDDKDVRWIRPCFINFDPESETTQRIRAMLSDKLRVTPEGRTNIFLVERAEIIRYIVTRDVSRFHCRSDINSRIDSGCDMNRREVVDMIAVADRIAVTTGDAYLNNYRHALSVIKGNELYLFDIGMFNGENLEVIEGNQP